MTINPDLATEVTLLAIDKTIYLREQMQLAAKALDAGRWRDAQDILRAALEKTDVGAMKVWQPGEEPF